MQEIPPKQNIPAAWYGPKLAPDTGQWIIDLGKAETAELEAAAANCLDQGMDFSRITKENFSLPDFGPRLAQLQDDLLRGIGFGVVRGLLVDDYSRDMTAAIFLGIGAHLGCAVSQNADGHLLGHVRDEGVSSTDTSVRIYQTSERQSFHTDSTDVVALLCLKDAESGGESLLVSAVTIFNEIAATRPDLLPRLFDTIATDRRGEADSGQKPYFRIPVFCWHKGFLTTIYQRHYIDSAQRFPDAPRLTEQHIEALDLFDALADDPRLNMSMRLGPGDMQFVYNHSLLHDRMGFHDHPNPNDHRHLLRLWLCCPGDRPLPDCYAERYGSTEIGNRGGIFVPGTRLQVVLD
jgi:hypothetical protein